MKLTFGEGLTIGFTLLIGGMLGLIGVALCITVIGLPVGIPLLIATGKMLQAAFNRPFKRIDAENKANDNIKLLKATITIEDGEDFPWMI